MNKWWLHIGLLVMVTISCHELPDLLHPEDEEVYNDLPTLAQREFSINANCQNGTIIDTIKTNDNIILGEIRYKITDGNHKGIFHLSKLDGVLMVKNSEPLIDKAHHQLTIEITDSSKYITTAHEKIKIQVINNEEISY